MDGVRREGGRGREGEKERSEKNMRGMGYSRRREDRDESKERDIFIEGAIIGQERNLALGKFPRIPKNESS